MKPSQRWLSLAVLVAAVAGVFWFTRAQPEPVAPGPAAAAPVQDPTADCLLPMMINEGELLAALEGQDAGPLAEELAWTSWLPPLGVGYVCDRKLGDAAWLTRGQLSRIPLDGGTVEALALRNLDARVGKLEFMAVGKTGVGTNKVDDVYAASLLLLDAPWLEFEQSQGPVVVAAPGRGKLFVAPRTAAFETALKQLADEAFKVEPNPLVPDVLGRRDGGWEWVR
jgi:hypothetical protein